VRREIRKVAVIGQGVIGRGWAAFFASRGLQVAVFDVDPAAARAAVDGLLETVSFLEREGLADSGVTDGLSSRVKLASSLEEAVAQADYVQEAVPPDIWKTASRPRCGGRLSTSYTAEWLPWRTLTRQSGQVPACAMRSWGRTSFTTWAEAQVASARGHCGPFLLGDGFVAGLYAGEAAEARRPRCLGNSGPAYKRRAQA